MDEIDRVSLEEGRRLFKKYWGKGTKSKYRNIKVEVDGLKFDSKKEAAYYWELKTLKQQGKIETFSLKPKIELQEAFTLPNGEKVSAISYIPDFVVNHNDGAVEIVDVKGMQTKDFKLKWKLLRYKFRSSTNMKFSLK